MPEEQLQQLRKMLEEERDSILANLNDIPDADDSEISSVDNHPADAASDLTLTTTEMALDDLKDDRLDKVESALLAIDEGTYGFCQECRKEIPFERLQAIPTAQTCVEHATE